MSKPKNRSELGRKSSILRKVVVMACLVASLSVVIFATFMATHERRRAVDVLDASATRLVQLLRARCMTAVQNEDFASVVSEGQMLIDSKPQISQIHVKFASGEVLEIGAQEWRLDEGSGVPTVEEEGSFRWLVRSFRESVFPSLKPVTRSETLFGRGGIDGWVSVRVDPEARAEDAAMQRYALTGKVGGLSLALGGLFAYFYSRNLTRPVKVLQKFAGQVARGKLDSRIDFRSDDEFGDLAESIVQMVTNLSLSQQKLMESMRKEASLREKDILLREIHHRVKNNMQILTSLLRLQGRRTKSSALKEVLQDSEARIRSMGLLHEKLYQSDNVSRIDLKGYLQTLVNELQQMNTDHKQPELRVTASSISLGLDSALPCGLIVTELVSNAFKYAFDQEEKPVVVVNVSKQATGEFSLVVWDNGSGLPQDFDSGKETSLGLRLVRMLAEQLNGEVAVSSEQGTRWEIIFRESQYKTRY